MTHPPVLAFAAVCPDIAPTGLRHRRGAPTAAPALRAAE